MRKKENTTTTESNVKAETDKTIAEKIVDKNESNEVQKTLTDFRKHLASEGKTATTIKSYAGDIEAFFSFCKKNGITLECGKFTRPDILGYKADLIEKNARAATVNVILNSLRAFNLFAIKAGIMSEMVVDTKADRITNSELAAMRSKDKAQ